MARGQVWLKFLSQILRACGVLTISWFQHAPLVNTRFRCRVYHVQSVALVVTATLLYLYHQVSAPPLPSFPPIVCELSRIRMHTNNNNHHDCTHYDTSFCYFFRISSVSKCHVDYVICTNRFFCSCIRSNRTNSLSHWAVCCYIWSVCL